MSGATATANRDKAAGGTADEHEGHLHNSDGSEASAAHVKASPEALSKLKALLVDYRTAGENANRAKLAEEIAVQYTAIAKFDSAGYYYEQVAAIRPGEKTYQKAADQYFEAFSFAATEERTKELSGKARELYNKVLQNNPANLDAKTNLAMTYIAAGEQPMQGIQLLREVITTNPNNEKALFNLGILSIQSGQYDKAVERFKHLVEVNPKHIQGNFYLAVSLAEIGKKEEARQVFTKAKTLDNNPEFQASIDTELEKLK
ncbi:tetratricopeptide repeat protein [Adhaeribacter aerolatus]|uniref:tetratricopeptide repeat protein n=1 Tax=Adhaeribacter aerolatus TaxID=670289 RepID=UPI001FE46384|nr:tetratricopeptide repeat protein [Adhaeribacter aerolatus]